MKTGLIERNWEKTNQSAHLLINQSIDRPVNALTKQIYAKQLVNQPINQSTDDSSDGMKEQTSFRDIVHVALVDDLQLGRREFFRQFRLENPTNVHSTRIG